jgi:hypothetical protein
MSELKVNKVTPRSGTTVTIGDSGEHLALAGNIGLGGATPTTSGTGITFPATASASTNANTLDDYEEGTFTPGFSGSTTAPSGVNYNGRNGYYTKIGRTVCVSMWLDLQSWSSAGTGTAIIAGLPFTSANLTNGYSAFNIGYAINFSATDTPQTGFLGGNQNFITLITNSGSDARSNLQTGAGAANMDGDEQMIISGVYITT